MQHDPDNWLVKHKEIFQSATKSYFYANDQFGLCDQYLLTGKAYYLANNEWFKGTGGYVNNSPVLEPEPAPNGAKKVPLITTEGGTLRKGLLHGVDYQILSQVCSSTLRYVTLEFCVTLHILRHTSPHDITHHHMASHFPS